MINGLCPPLSPGKEGESSFLPSCDSAVNSTPKLLRDKIPRGKKPRLETSFPSTVLRCERIVLEESFFRWSWRFIKRNTNLHSKEVS
ncbi:hypothetical protein CEXT_199221 [Caerostris extrusa]|uniref:Uncharacterized protein n=1 Tax=Caerostris extrusa TaxID=172846 RepID=A0AAV4WVA8_CAEEX|nr:hypothetical protein CEXT_199221 [Caerostris extrusa]